MSLLGNIDAIREELFIERFINELKVMNSLPVYDDNKEDNNEQKERIKMLETIINVHNDKLKAVESSYKDKKSLKDDLNDINKLVFQKSWNKLPDYHKMEKIKEYVTNLINDKKQQQIIIADLNNLLISKKLGVKIVDYDSTNCVIKSISVLTYNEKDKIYEIKN